MIHGPLRAAASRMACVVVVAASFIGCQALKDALPTKPSEPAPAPSQAPVSIPVILPTPAPTPTPVLGGPTSPTPTPAPGSTPAPTPAPPSGGTCGLPASNHPDAPCSMQSSSFLGAVDSAITKVIEQKPNMFDFSRKNCENCPMVNDQDGFVSALIKQLNSAGYCAKYDGEELAVKNSNSFNEQFDILVSSGHVRRGPGSYRSTCSPSWF
jgi:hypothetical protein